MMTDDELTAIRARAEAATDGLLVVEHDTGGKWKVFGPQSAIARDMSEDDAALFANARRDVLTLLAEVERLRTLLATLPMDEMNIALEISGETQYGHRVVNLLTWHNDNEAAVGEIARQWHDAHSVKAPVE